MMLAFLLGLMIGVCCTRLYAYLDEIKGDVFCYSWPRCWKRATHYIVIPEGAVMDEGMCHRHAEIRAVEIITETEEDPAVCSLPEAMQRARLNRALHFNGDED
jgi:hypothetical protein